jgi:hypothetical protein
MLRVAETQHFGIAAICAKANTDRSVCLERSVTLPATAAKRRRPDRATAWREAGLLSGYTGSRNGDICEAATIPTIGRGYVDLEKGIFRRKPDDKKETSKRQPTVPIPPRLLAHMRRWQRLGISQRAVIEFNGKPVGTIREGWESRRRAGGSGDRGQATEGPPLHPEAHGDHLVSTKASISRRSASTAACPWRRSARPVATSCRELSTSCSTPPIRLGVEYRDQIG